ncbi:MAG: hypothetical protein JF609_11300, partial [Verrucomicrobia bacterium]|nr:hypothetical protein [Verrucomicrobiota bacterium]
MKPTTPSPISRNACSPSTRFGALHLATMLVAVFSLSAQAGVDYWDGTGNLWGTASFWSTASGATTPDPVTAPVAGDQAVFNTTILNTSQTVYLGGNQSVSNLVFNSTGATTLLGGSSGSPAANTLTLGSNTNS